VIIVGAETDRLDFEASGKKQERALSETLNGARLRWQDISKICPALSIIGPC
jgi:hypothetical protein